MKRKVKAWAVIIKKSGNIPDPDHCYWITSNDPENYIYSNRLGVVPCTITYTLPKKERKRKR